ncbi:hypothetical protein [Laceyella putida]|uniref:Uncharacterized protein n=1 Tax=Laceyella putida TaxID=110101 RepID=A0ABW2RHC5_9BACL
MNRQNEEGRKKNSGKTKAISQYLNVPEEYIRKRLTKQKREWVFSRLKEISSQKNQKGKNTE